MRRRYSKEVFYEALRRSFIDIASQESVKTITKTMVISNAKFPNGSSVGETTLYGKSPKTKEFVHKDFLLELEMLIDQAQTALAKKNNVHSRKTETSKNAVVRLRAEKRVLEMENSSILAQFVMLEEHAKNQQFNADKNTIKTLEQELYIIASVLNRRISGSVKEIAESVNLYEVKYAGQNRLAYAKEEISNLERKIQDAAVVSIFGNLN